MSPLLIALIVALILGVGIAVTFAAVRHRYVKSLEAKGWTFTPKPGLSVTYGLNCAPFGLGFDRLADNLISGTAGDGTQFRCFRYSSTAIRQALNVLAMPLPHSLPADALTGIAADLAEGEHLSVDHNQLLLIGVPMDAAGLELAIARLAAARSALLASPPRRGQRSGPPS